MATFLELLGDPNFQNLLAGVGTQLGGPGSVGAALGTSTISFNKAQAAQRAAKTTLERNATKVAPVTEVAPIPDVAPSSLNTGVTPVTEPPASKLSYAVKDPSVLATEVADLLTPPDVAGPTSVARDKAGQVKVSYTPVAKTTPAQDEISGLLGTSRAETEFQSPTGEVEDLLSPYLARRSVQQQLASVTAPGGEQVRTDARGRILQEKSIILTPKSSQEDYVAAVAQGARRRNLDPAMANELVGSAYEGARKQRGVDQARFDADPNYSVNTTLDYLDSVADKYPKLRPSTTVQTTTPQPTPGVEVTPTQAEVDALISQQSPSRPSDLTVDIEKTSPPLTRQEPGTAEASTPQKPAVQTQAEQLADILNLPITEVSPKGNQSSTPSARKQVDLGTLDIEKKSPQVTPLTPKVVREQYDLRGLSPGEVDQVVNRAIDAERNDIARSVDRRENTQLIETDDGYLVLNKRTRELTPLTREGKVDAKQLLALDKHKRLSEFSREMSAVPGTDTVVRGKMNDAQSKDFLFGSRALQANERQRRLEQRLGDDPEKFATRRAYMLQTLEALPADVSMNVINTITTGASLLGSGARAVYEKFLADNPTASTDKKTEFLTKLGLGASEARAQAILENRLILSADEREFLQNSIEFSTAMLRRESGAAINAGEFLSTYRQYFPTVGDKTTDVLRKMRTRQQAIRGLRTSAGRPLLVPDVED